MVDSQQVSMFRAIGVRWYALVAPFAIGYGAYLAITKSPWWILIALSQVPAWVMCVAGIRRANGA